MVYGIGSGAYCFLLLIVVVVFGLMNNSKESNIVLTYSYVSGGTVFRKVTQWDRLGSVWMGQYDLLWKGRNAKGGKPYTCKTAYGQFGRECRHNNRHVSIDLALEWIEALRDAGSEGERRELIRKFMEATPRTVRSIASLAPDERAKADKLLKELHGGSSQNWRERKMEIRQYFASKGWAIPQNEPSPAKRVFGCVILIGVLVFWVFFFALMCSRM